MSTNAHDAYLESKVLTADPVELVRMLYRGAIERIREARVHLADGNIPGRSKAILGAVEILAELSSSLNHQGIGDVSRRLAELYDYMQRRLLEGNYKQTEEPLTEVLGLLTTLLEGWSGMRMESESGSAEAQTAGLLQLAANTSEEKYGNANNPLFQKLPPESRPYASQSWTA